MALAGLHRALCLQNLPSLTAFFVTIQYFGSVRCQAAQIKGLCNR